MAVGVVDLFETIDVQHHHRQGPLKVARLFQLSLQATVEIAAVEELGQVVPHGHVLQFQVANEQPRLISPLRFFEPSSRHVDSGKPQYLQGGNGRNSGEEPHGVLPLEVGDEYHHYDRHA